MCCYQLKKDLTAIALLIGAVMFGWAGEVRGFSLITPPNESFWNTDSSGSRVTFVWDKSAIPDTVLDLYFELEVIADISRWDTTHINRRDSVMIHESLLDTSYTYDFSCFRGDYGMGRVPISWKVTAVIHGGWVDAVECETPFTFTLLTRPPGNHPPSHFALVSPRHIAIIESRTGAGFPPEGFIDSVLFTWHPSVDLDSSAEVRYRFQSSVRHLVNGVEDSIWADETISDTFLWANVDGIVDLMESGRYYRADWYVSAVSQGDTIECDARFICQFFWELSVNEKRLSLPETATLDSPHPNPFNSTTMIRYGLGKPEYARIVIYDMTGKPVEVLQDGMMGAGWHEAVWKVEGLGAGLYFVRLEAGGKNEVRKVVMVR